jgi:hypothetical protein
VWKLDAIHMNASEAADAALRANDYVRRLARLSSTDL